jgi:hypothetical protein
VSAGRRQANALIACRGNATRIFGPPIAGALIALQHRRRLLVDAVTFAVSAISLLAPAAPREPGGGAATVLAELASGWRGDARPWIV